MSERMTGADRNNSESKFKIGDKLTSRTLNIQATVTGVFFGNPNWNFGRENIHYYSIAFGDGSSGEHSARYIDASYDLTKPLGVKNDQGKPRMSLLFTRALKPAIICLVRVLEYGLEKYPNDKDDNWIQVDNGVERYRDAALRHLAESKAGEVFDADSKLRHLGSAACSCLFALAHEIKNEVAK